MTEAAEGGETQTGGGETIGGYDYKELHNFSIDKGMLLYLQPSNCIQSAITLIKFRSILCIYLFKFEYETLTGERKVTFDIRF